MRSELDDHGQPLTASFNQARRTERDISELLGLAKGLLADGGISVEEADLLRAWVSAHPDAAEKWPIRRLAERLTGIYADGRVDEEERLDLADLLKKLLGGETGILGDTDTATALPLDRPAPTLVWTGRVYVFTGQMAFGPRRECEKHVMMFGGICEARLTLRTNYLVIGTFGSRDWVHTAFGRKIEKAVEYRESGQPIAIVSEDHWATQLPAHASGDQVVRVFPGV
jgi:hypothetical protein